MIPVKPVRPVSRPGRRLALRHLGALLGGSLLLTGLSVLAHPTATADTAPQNPNDPATPVTVSNDALPSPQINGVVWTQAMVGNTVYVGGSFSNARPAGSPAGQNTVPRANILAFDVTTGQLRSFAPTFNAQVRSVAVSPDKTRVYVGGEFTTVNGQSRRRIAAFNAGTGALIASFAPPINYDVAAVVATNTTVYAGGSFLGVGNTDRQYLAAFNASNGALLDWAPQATGGTVAALAINPQGTKVAIGGGFTALNGSSNPGYGLGMVDATTGASLPFAANQYVRNGTVDGAIDSLATDGTYVYGGGWTFGRAGGTWEGIFAASWNAGEVRFLDDCHGDMYSVFPIGNVVYGASHTHYCENIDGVRQGAGGVGDYPYYRGIALGTQPTGTVTWEPSQGRYYNFAGQPRSSWLGWYPSINAGTYTGRSRGARSMTGNSDYVVMAGEFTRVNGTGQQGIVRFAVSSKAPNDAGPSLFNTRYPLKVTSTQAGQARVNWSTNNDSDNEYLTYRVYRDTQNAAGLIYTTSLWARSWLPYTTGFTDTGLAPGSTHQYRVVVTDPFGNAASSPWTSVTIASGGTDSNYVKAVYGSQPTHYWRLGEPAGSTTMADRVGFLPLTANTGVTRGTPGAISGDNDASSRFNGTTSGYAAATTPGNPPDVVSVETWFRTTTNLGGRLLGWGNRNASNSSNDDRQLYMDNAGHILFGVKPSSLRVTVASPKVYNNGQWHHAVGTLSTAGMKLYVDGVQVGARADVISGQHLDIGYWRIGGDSLNGWPSIPLSAFFAGDLDEVAVYYHELSATEVAAHHAAGIGTPTTNHSPVAAFTSTVSGLTATVNGSGSSDPDGTIASYAWTFGDGGSATGVSPAPHTYAVAGSYNVTLTVTDDDGATNSLTKVVTVSTEPAPFALDAFSRTVTGGWGNADLGGAWTHNGTSTNFNVAGGVGTIRMGSAGAGPSVSLTGVSSSSTELRTSIGLDKAATGGGVYVDAQPRISGTGDLYYATTRYLSDGTVSLTIGRIVGGTDTALQARVVTGLTVAVGDRLNVKVQALGSSPTTLRAKVWKVGTTEPSTWTASTTDSTAALQVAGSIGLATYLSGSATNAPVIASFDDVWGGPAQ